MFNYPEDRSIAQIQQTYVQVENELNKPENPNMFNAHKFEDQFKKYLHVLDTDYKSYLVLYSCQEEAEWREERSGREMGHEDVWRASINQRQYNRDPEPESLYLEENFVTLRGIKKSQFHKQKIQIYTRPKHLPAQKQYSYQPFDGKQLEEIKQEISSLYLYGHFTAGIL